MQTNAETRARDDRIRSFDFDLDQWLLELVLVHHPDWRQDDGSCPNCWLEIERMRARADALEVVAA